VISLMKLDSSIEISSNEDETCGYNYYNHMFRLH